MLTPQNKSCNQLPNFLVVGPQKTGSTALYSFLKLHPNIISSEFSESTFEEVQFFNEKYYYNGLDWYKSFFPVVNSSTTMIFEKSATYFDAENVPFRAHKLLPAEKIGMKLILHFFLTPGNHELNCKIFYFSLKGKV